MNEHLTKKPLVSILIPTFNRAMLLKRAVESVLKQDYPNIEIIISDNASEDNTTDIVNSFSSEKIKYIKREKNIGAVLNGIEGYKNVSGKYYMLLCDDDYLVSNTFISNSVEVMENNDNINPYVFMKYLFNNLKENDNVITSNGAACVISFQAGIIKKNQRLFTNSGCASMGYGLPSAIGGCIANNNKRTICIEGDGSIMMNLQELQTVYHNKLNLKIFILNNNGYHSMRQTQANLFNSKFCGVDKNSGISFPNFEKIAYAFDIEYYKIERFEEIDNTMKKAFEKDLPNIIEVFLDEKQFFEPKLSSKVHEDGTITSPPLDDMFPFLDKEEYESVISFLKGN